MKMQHASYDVVGVGHAIVDVLAPTTDEYLAEHGIAKGGMTLVDSFRAEVLGRSMRGAVEASGGSAANTLVGLASFGGTSAFLGKVNADRLGKVFAEDIAKSSVHFSSRPAQSSTPTASCHILITPDGQRSMNTFLGCAAEIESADMSADVISAGHIFYIEGYLWDSPGAKTAIRKGIEHAKKSSRKVAFTLSDAFCVGRWRDEFKALLTHDIDIVFANESEAKALHETQDFDAAFQAFRSWGKTAVITRSEKGCVVTSKSEVHIIDAEPVDHVVDTTGAGDQFAAGVLFGLARNLPLNICGRLGAVAAAEVISHVGPRPAISLKALAARTGLI